MIIFDNTNSTLTIDNNALAGVAGAGFINSVGAGNITIRNNQNITIRSITNLDMIRLINNSTANVSLDVPADIEVTSGSQLNLTYNYAPTPIDASAASEEEAKGDAVDETAPMTGVVTVEAGGSFELHSVTGFNVQINYAGTIYNVCSSASIDLDNGILEGLIALSGPTDALSPVALRAIDSINHRLLEEFIAHNADKFIAANDEEDVSDHNTLMNQAREIARQVSVHVAEQYFERNLVAHSVYGDATHTPSDLAVIPARVLAHALSFLDPNDSLHAEAAELAPAGDVAEESDAAAHA